MTHVVYANKTSLIIKLKLAENLVFCDITVTVFVMKAAELAFKHIPVKKLDVERFGMSLDKKRCKTFNGSSEFWT